MSKKIPAKFVQFLEHRFGPEGGRTQVVNTNLDSRDVHPRVSVFTLLKTDERFRKKILAEYARHRRETTSTSGDSSGILREPVRVRDDIELPPGARDIHELMRTSGHELYLVGGAVRDHVLGKTPKDFDLATDAEPDKVVEILSRNPDFAERLDITGKQFGVVRVKDPQGEEYEIATFRKDVGEGRRPDAVEFTTIDQDVGRRDLTINALFYDLDRREIVDYVGGIEDAREGVVRTVGRPEDRFREDKLRVLRVPRFAGRLEADIDDETREAIRANPSLEGVSPERVRDEFVRGVASAKDPSRYVEMMGDLGLLAHVFPGLEVGSSSSKSSDPVVQAAALLAGNDPKTLEKALKSLKYSGDEVGKVLLLHKLRRLEPGTANGLRKAYKKLKMQPETVQEGAEALGEPSGDELDVFLEYVEAPPELTGKELAARGVKKGPEMGKAIAEAEAEGYRRRLERRLEQS